jgi:branched-chain amino acid transport system substrate-binding protein
MKGVILAAMLLSLQSLIVPADAQSPDQVFRIGLVTDMDSVYADTAGKGSVVAAQMAIEDFGATVLGRPIELLTANDQNKPDIAAAIARKWYEVDRVETIVAGGNSSVALAIQTIARDRDRVLLLGGPGLSDLTGKSCARYSTHWAFDSHSAATATGQLLARRERGKSWFFLTADYSFGNALERDTSRVVVASGGTVAGSVKVPLNSADFSSFLLRAQGSGASTIGLDVAGADLTNAIKQANEFQIGERGQELAALLAFITDVNSIGLRVAQGITTSESFYWDLNEQTRAWSRRYMDKMPGKVPSMIHAGVYSAVLHYLRSVSAAGTTEASSVVKVMKSTPVNDFNNRDVHIRDDGRVMNRMYVFRVKSPAQSKYPFDFYELIGDLPGADVFRPISESECPHAAK